MIVGLTGHRPNRLHIGIDRVRDRLTRVLRRLKREARTTGRPRGRFVALSALAEGSDRLFAEAGLALNYELRVLLPFARHDYETTFGDSSTTPAFRALLAQASTVHELPGTLTADTEAYEAVGRAVVDRCDVLISVWDGRPAAGRGGTPEIIAYGLAQKRPVIWIDASRDRPPRLLRRSTASGRTTAVLARLAPLARPY